MSTVPRRLTKFGLAVIRNNRILLCEPYAYPELIVPGGIKEGGETHVENLVREVREELGEFAELDIESLRYLGRFEDVAAGRTERSVEIDLYLGSLHGKLRPSSEIKQLHWFGPSDDQARLSPIVRRKILPHLIRENLLSNWAADK